MVCLALLLDGLKQTIAMNSLLWKLIFCHLKTKGNKLSIDFRNKQTSKVDIKKQYGQKA